MSMRGSVRGALAGLAALLAVAALQAAAAAPQANDAATVSTSPPTSTPTPTSTPASKNDAVSPAGPHYRLPVTAIPVHYTIDLKMGPLGTDTFTGKVTIDVVAVRPASFLTLHVDHKVLEVTKSTVNDGNGNPLQLGTQPVRDEQLQTLTLEWSGSPMTPGSQYTVDIDYKGTLRKDMYGFYRSTFTTKQADGSVKTVNLAATQFEPTHARSAFPCWDEPHYKAVFKLSISHAPSQQVLANTVAEKPKTVDDVKTTPFAATPRMSTYLVAFVVSDDSFLTPTPTGATVDPTAGTPTGTTPMPYSVLVRPGQTDQARYAAEVGPKSLEWLSGFTNLPYKGMGLGKLDLIAIPDFSAGAMENWGLITFRETGLMFLDGESTESSKESIALVIAHEQAHMWFGDLVSPEWWGYVWLNEGFARYMQYVAMDKVQPKWNLMEKFVVQTLQGALAFDALASSHPMSATVYSPDEIQGIFDRISYDKGASVLHMTRNVLGDGNFQTAIQKYLAEMSNFVAAPRDLFRALDGVRAAPPSPLAFPMPAGLTLATVLKTWTEEAGYPVVTLRKEANGTITVTQSRFSSSEDAAARAGDTRWWVPLTYVLEGGSFDNPAKLWLDPDAASPIDSQGKKWVVANIKQTGFYRVNYDEGNWAAVGELLQGQQGVDAVPALSRAALLDDALSLARAGALRYATALDLTRYLSAEKHAMPWTAVLPHLAFLHKALAGDKAQDTFKEYILGLLDAVYVDVGFREEQDQDTDTIHQRLIFRSTLLGHACRLGHEGCVSNATAAFKAFLSSTAQKVPPSQRSTVYCTGLRQGDAADWQAMWGRYSDSTTSPGERSLILAALGCSSDEDKLKELLGYSLDASKVRPQDAQAAFSAVLNGNDGNLDVALQFFKDNVQRMSERYGGWSSMQKVVEGLAGKMFDESKVKELEEVLSSNGPALGVAQAAATRSLETARANLAWRQRHLPAVAAWARGGASAAPAPAAASLGRLGLGIGLVWLLRRPTI